MAKAESRDRISNFPSIETKVEGQPLITVNNIDWPRIFGLIGEGRKPHLKRIVICGENIQNLQQLTQLWETKGEFGVYSASKGEITLNVDRIFNYNFYLMLRENEFFRYADGQMFIVPLRIETQLGLALLGTLVHETEHSLQLNNNLAYDLLTGIELASMLLATLFIFELGSVELNTILGVWFFSQVSVVTAISHLQRQKKVPYLEKPDEIAAREKANWVKSYYNQNKEKLPFSYSVDWKRLYTLASK